MNSIETRNFIKNVIKTVTGINATYRESEGSTIPRSIFFEVTRDSITASNTKVQKRITYQISIYTKKPMEDKMDLLQEMLESKNGFFVKNWREELVDEKSQGIIHYAIDFEVFVHG